jgi:hypothetical protein
MEVLNFAYLWEAERKTKQDRKTLCFIPNFYIWKSSSKLWNLEILSIVLCVNFIYGEIIVEKI